MVNQRIPGGAPFVWAIIDNVADAIGSIGASGEPELRVYDDEKSRRKSDLDGNPPRLFRRAWMVMMNGVMVRQEGCGTLVANNGTFVHTTPGMTTDEAIATIPSTELE